MLDSAPIFLYSFFRKYSEKLDLLFNRFDEKKTWYNLMQNLSNSMLWNNAVN